MRADCVLFVALLAVPIGHAALVGIAVDPLHPPNGAGAWSGLPYVIDPMTGAVTPITQGLSFMTVPPTPADSHFFLTIGDSPYPGAIFGSSPVNLYTANYDTGVAEFYSSAGSALDLALDSTHGVLYASFGDRLSTIALTPCLGPCPPQAVVGSFGLPDIAAMGYVPGDGLYGVDGTLGNLWRIDPKTAALTLVGPTGVGLLVNGLSITDIEFDPATGRLIATAGGIKQFSSGPVFAAGKIYLLDRFTGATTLLNDNAPNFYSMADATPEPGNLVLVTAALLLFGGLRRRYRRTR